jgi:hypothetical protein
MSGTVQSNNVFLNATNTISAVGSGGASTPNLDVSTLSAFALLNISSINGAPYVGAGGVPANLTVSSISTLALNSISSINGVAYTGAGGAVPANLGVSSLIVNAGDLTILANAGAPTQGRAIIDGTGFGIALTGYNDANSQTTFIQSAESGGAQELVLSVGSAPETRITINQNTGTTISTLTVSSFNGALGLPFSAGTFNLGISSFSTPQLGGIFPVNGTLVQFSTTVGHTYTVDYGAFISPVQPSVDPATIPVDNEIGFSVICGSATAGNLLQTQQVYQIARGLRSTYTINDKIVFLAGDTGARFGGGYVSNNAVDFNFTNATTISSSTRVIVTDLGVI